VGPKVSLRHIKNLHATAVDTLQRIDEATLEIRQGTETRSPLHAEVARTSREHARLLDARGGDHGPWKDEVLCRRPRRTGPFRHSHGNEKA
jgi:hypothetical protein